ncbi:gamma-glutamylcyclotransferase [Parahaliea maris]|uniref:Gamma-glutamylcyclotransferase n=1 Tax=Parahaliea maris TaxID=2716870 RepID=A0A5C8ZZ56_9GAMM|nr:gamma-glutamylcyclotransferase family protein [Parahaliea maris]TXS92902.1 gamma-glutamylcyclotransferase [Parahaliea maris]
MRYFAYGSNMSLARLRERVPSAARIGCYALREHDLRFHKSGRDGSAKCDAFFTASGLDVIHGALFEIDPGEKPYLDRVEGLGFGYDEKEVILTASNGARVTAVTYVATVIDHTLKPYSWHLNHVHIGATEIAAPGDYVERKILAVDVIEDRDTARDSLERAIHHRGIAP